MVEIPLQVFFFFPWGNTPKDHTAVVKRKQYLKLGTNSNKEARYFPSFGDGGTMVSPGPDSLKVLVATFDFCIVYI